MKEIMAAFRLREKATRYQDGESQGLALKTISISPHPPSNVLLATLERLFI